MLHNSLRCSLISAAGRVCLPAISRFVTSKQVSFNQQVLKRTLTTFDNSFSTDDISRASPHVRNLLENNRAWVKETNEKDPEFFTRLAKVCQRYEVK